MDSVAIAGTTPQGVTYPLSRANCIAGSCAVAQSVAAARSSTPHIASARATTKRTAINDTGHRQTSGRRTIEGHICTTIARQFNDVITSIGDDVQIALCRVVGDLNCAPRHGILSFTCSKTVTYRNR